MQLRRWSERLKSLKRGGLSLPLAVALPFMVQTLVVVGLIGYLSYRTGERTILSLVNQLMQETGDRVSLYVDAAYLDAANDDAANDIDAASAETVQESVAIAPSVAPPVPDLSSYLQQNSIGDSGTLLIHDKQGKIIASSIDGEEGGSDVPNQSGESTLLSPGVPIFQAAGQALYPQIGAAQSNRELTDTDLQASPPDVLKPTRFVLEGKRYFTKSLALDEEQGLDWLMVAVVPASEFTGSIRANVLRTLILCGVALLSSVAIGALVARQIMSPLQKLNRVTQALAQENFDALAPLESVAQRPDSIGRLGRSFDEMAAHLKHTIHTSKNEQQRLLTFLDAMPLGVLIHSADSNVFYINPTGRTLIGAKPSISSSTNALATHYQICHGETQQPYPNHSLPPILALGGEEAVANDLTVHCGDRLISLDVRAVPVLASNGAVEYAITVFQDITERKHKERLLNRYNRDLSDQVTETVHQLEYEHQQLQTTEAQLQKIRYELNHLSKVDNLTHISNRRRFNERLTEEWQRQTRSQVPLSLILIEIDDFQAYKEVYDQQQSDRCLVSLARSLKQALKRPADLVARYGTDVFAAILPETDLPGAQVVAKRIHWLVQRLNILHQASSVSSTITVSIGIATTVPALGMIQSSLVTEASRMLHEAKTTGGDRQKAIEFGHHPSSGNS